MSAFPSEIVSPRTISNRPGVVFNPDDTKTLFAEDLNAINDELVAIETELLGAQLISGAEVAITGAITLDASAFGKMHVCSGTSADYTVGLPAVSGNAGKVIGIRMANSLTKIVTIDGNASELIDGILSRPMWKDEVAIFLCSGTYWTKIAGKSVPMLANLYKASNTSTITSATPFKILIDSVALDNSGRMADTANSKIIIRRAGKYMLDANVWVDPSGKTIQRMQVLVYKNGSLLQALDCPAWTAAAYLVGQIPQFVFDLAVNDYLELYIQTAHTAGTMTAVCGAGKSHIALTELISF